MLHRIKVTFILQNGERETVDAPKGASILDVAHENDIDLEGACEGSVACSTCHVVVDPEYYDKLSEPTDEENDMLDLAFGLEETSRLGCQVELNKELDGITVKLPSATRTFSTTRCEMVHTDKMQAICNSRASPCFDQRQHTTMYRIQCIALLISPSS